MKIEQKKAAFQPVSITFENEIEFNEFITNLKVAETAFLCTSNSLTSHYFSWLAAMLDDRTMV